MYIIVKKGVLLRSLIVEHDENLLETIFFAHLFCYFKLMRSLRRSSNIKIVNKRFNVATDTLYIFKSMFGFRWLCKPLTNPFLIILNVNFS